MCGASSAGWVVGGREAVAAIGQAGRQANEGLVVLRDSARLQQSVQASVEQVHAAIGLATQAAAHQAQGAQAYEWIPARAGMPRLRRVI